MGITKGLIELHYNSAVKQAKALEQVADRLDSEAIILCKAIKNSVAQSWKGSSAGGYAEKVEQLQNNIQENRTYIREIASAIRKTAEAVRKSENAELAAETDKTGSSGITHSGGGSKF